MMQCVSIAVVSVHVNDTPGPQFVMERGLREGCVLSSLLFNLVAKVISMLVNQF